MKKINILILVAASVLATGCKGGFFSTESPSAMDEASVFSSSRQTEQVIAGIYTIFGEQNSYRSRLCGQWVSFNTDIEWQNDLASYNNYAMTKDGHSDITAKDKHPWVYYTSAIERANLCINGIQQYGDTSDVDIRYLWGEALTLRAFLYYEMTKLWGDVPYNFEPLDVNTTEAIYVTKCDRNKIYDKLRVDLVKAIELMPYADEITWGPAHNTVERMNKQFACGLLARIDLAYAGMALRPDTWIEGGGASYKVQPNTIDATLRSELLGEAVKYTEMVMNHDGVEIGGKLKANYEDVFRAICGNVTEYGKTETLWEIPFANNVRGQFLNRMGAYVNKTALGKVLHTTATSKSNLKVVLTPDFVLSFDKNDTRKWVTVNPYEWVYDSENTTKVDPELAYGDTIVYQKPTKANKFYLGKYRFEWLNYDVTGDDDGLNMPVMRYSDILLMYAEAMIGGVTGDAPSYTGSKSALDVLNIVRRRAGLAEKAQCELADIQEERAKEFAGEHIRKYDLMRWGILGSSLVEAEAKLEAFGKVKKDPEDASKFIIDLAGTEYDGRVNDKVYVKLQKDNSAVNKGFGYVITDIYGLALDELGTPEGFDEPNHNGWRIADVWVSKNSATLKGKRIFANGLDANAIDNRQYWPIFEIILASNPRLWNDYGY